jgi:hypothetical protein
MNSTYTFAGILGILLSVWLTHRLTIGRDRIAQYRNAGRDIANAFRLELDALIQTSEDAGLVLTDAAFEKHESAIRTFSPQLPLVKRMRIRNAWRDLAYHKDDKQHSVPAYFLYADCGSLTKRWEIRPVAIKHIQRIISIAS